MNASHTLNEKWQLDELAAQHQRALLIYHDNIAPLRASSFATYQKQGWPSRKQERWQYTRLHELMAQAFLPAVHVQAEVLPSGSFADAVSLVFVDGFFQEPLSDLDELPEEIVAMPLAALTEEYVAIYAEYLADLKESDNAFAQLNMALCNSGLFVYVPKGVKFDRPIEVLYINSQTQPVVTHLHNVFIIDEGAKISIAERYETVRDSVYFNNVLTQIATLGHVQLDYYKLQQESLHAFHVANTVFYQSLHSEVSAKFFASGARMQRDDITSELAQADASLDLVCLALAKKEQQIGYYSNVNHRSDRGRSQQTLRCICDDNATVSFNGRIFVAPSSRETDAHLQNRNLLLSQGARVNTKPELEIYNDNLSCSHGATVGELDQQALFYLRSRGMPESQARQLLLQGFVEELLQAIPLETVADYVQNSMLADYISYVGDIP